jgi:16S rRNA (guanine1207-N2)-methyltransferase
MVRCFARSIRPELGNGEPDTPFMQDPLAALTLTLENHPEFGGDGRVLFLRARAGFLLEQFAGRLDCEQPYKPWASAVEEAGHRIVRGSKGPYSLVMLLPDRQRQAMYADIARAHDLLSPGGVLVVALPNDWGAKRTERQLRDVAGETESVSKHRSRVFWARKGEPSDWDAEVLGTWRAEGALQRVMDGRFWSQPGLFSWNRIDPGSQLLTEHLPEEISGRVADLGIGWGFLSVHLLSHCHDIDSLDGYDADVEAMEAARRNLGNVQTPVRARLHWHDVTAGLGNARFDWIVSNPPFHEGRAAESVIGVRFITSAAQALAPGGQFWLVANRHLPYEGVLAELFDEWEQVADRDGFKVLAARGSKVPAQRSRQRKGKWKSKRRR